MRLPLFTEKQINNSLKRKLPDVEKGSDHWMGYLMVDGTDHGQVKIPNVHQKYFGKKKTGKMIKALMLSRTEYKNLIECPLKKKEYLNILRGKIKIQES